MDDELRRQLIRADVLRRQRINPEDEDFADIVSQQLSGHVNPSYARHVKLGLNDEQLDDGVELNMRGLHHPEDTEPSKVKGTNVVSYPGEVIAFHTANTPLTYAHEYRHKNYPELGEGYNRLIDMVAAKSDWDVDETMRLRADWMRDKIPSDAIDGARGLIQKLQFGRHPKAYSVIEKELERLGIDMTVDEFIEASKMQRFLDDAEDLNDYNEGLEERNKARMTGEDESVMDTLRRIIDKLR